MRFGIALLWLGLLPVAGQTPLPRELRDHSQNLAPVDLRPRNRSSIECWNWP